MPAVAIPPVLRRAKRVPLFMLGSALAALWMIARIVLGPLAFLLKMALLGEIITIGWAVYTGRYEGAAIWVWMFIVTASLFVLAMKARGR